MKRCLLGFVILIMFFGTAFAEEETSLQSGAFSLEETSLRAGAFSLDVAIPESDSVLIGGKYFLSNNTALECGASLNLQAEKESKGQEDGYATEISGAYVYYLSNSRISPYLKGGATVSYKTGDYYENRNVDGFGLGLLAGFGTEFFVTKEFSISAQAQINVQFSPTIYFRTFTPLLKASFYF